MEHRQFTFDTTHHALWAEEITIENGFAAELVPAPPGATARCDLALETLPEAFDAVAELLRTNGIPFAIHPPDTDIV